MASKTASESFESKIQRLESLITGLENSDQSLEDALQSFEQGVKIVLSVQEELKKAEQKVQQLTAADTGEEDT